LSSRLVRNSVLLVVLAVFGLALLWTYMLGGSEAKPYTYSQLLTDAANGNVKTIQMDGDRLTVQLSTQEEPVTAIAPMSTTRSAAPPATRTRPTVRLRSSSTRSSPAPPAASSRC